MSDATGPDVHADTRSLDECRQRIDHIDGEIIQLLSERAQAAQRIGALKHAAGEAIFAPHRERNVYASLCDRNPGPLTDHSIRAIWREIISGCISLEEPLTICHFGRPGSFTHQASRARFGDSVTYSAVESIPVVFETVERGHADYGVVPIENSTDGGITDTIDAFLATNLRIVSELHLRVRHHLMATCELKNVQRVYSKNTVFGQCRQWLATHLPGVELVETGSTTQAAEKAAREDGSAAIGNEEASGKFGIQILAHDIQDIANNTTRFVVLAVPDKAPQPSGNDKTSIMFAVKDRPGALYEALIPFHQAGISLSRIESRPNRRQPWEYLFFIDIHGHQDDQVIQDAIATFSEGVSTCEILGSYPRAEHALND